MSARRPQRHQSGAALLLAMVIVVLVSTVAAGMVWQQTRAINVEAAERARAQAGWVLAGAMDWARLILREDQRSGQQRSNAYDGLDEPWAQPLAEARLSAFLAADKDNNTDSGPEAFISGAIEDAQSRFNLRGLVDDSGRTVVPQLEGLRRMVALVGLPTDTADLIAQALQGVSTAAAADAQGGPPLRPTRLADLAWLGIAKPTIERLAPFVDLLPAATPVNANTAPLEVLVAALDIDAGTAQRLVQARGRESFKSMDAVAAQLPQGLPMDPARVAVGSSYFRVSGRLRLDERVLEERSLLVRRDNRVEVLQRERQSFAALPR